RSLPARVVATSQGLGLLPILYRLTLLAVVFGCVVLHELGHALTARRFGIRTLDITLYPIGGVARLERLPERPTEELLIALAGPAVNLAIVALLTPLLLAGAFLTPGAEEALAPPALLLAVTFLVHVWVANAVLVLFNLLPTFPMDGGRVLRAVLAYRLGAVRATAGAEVGGRGGACW